MHLSIATKIFAEARAFSNDTGRRGEQFALVQKIKLGEFFKKSIVIEDDIAAADGETLGPSDEAFSIRQSSEGGHSAAPIPPNSLSNPRPPSPSTSPPPKKMDASIPQATTAGAQGPMTKSAKRAHKEREKKRKAEALRQSQTQPNDAVQQPSDDKIAPGLTNEMANLSLPNPSITPDTLTPPQDTPRQPMPLQKGQGKKSSKRAGASKNSRQKQEDGKTSETHSARDSKQAVDEKDSRASPVPDQAVTQARPVPENGSMASTSSIRGEKVNHSGRCGKDKQDAGDTGKAGATEAQKKSKPVKKESPESAKVSTSCLCSFPEGN